jgi:hypothetical protein
VATAAGQPIAPFFRFPGLNDSSALIKHLEGRNIATFTVDVVSNDSYIADVGRLTSLTLERLEAENGGIMLFHDIKHQTARALPGLLAEMRRRGYKVVHLVAKHPFEPNPQYSAAVAQYVAAKKIGPQRPALVAVVETPVAPSPSAPAQRVPGAPAVLADAATPVEAETAEANADTRPVPANRRGAAAVVPAAPIPTVTAPLSVAGLGVAAPAASDVAAASAPATVAVAHAQVPAPAASPAPTAAEAPPPIARPAAAATVQPRAQPRPTPSPQQAPRLPAVASTSAPAAPAAPQIEILAGAYPSKPPAGVPLVIPAGPTAPAIVAGSYASPPARPKPERTWQQGLRERISDSGN